MLPSFLDKNFRNSLSKLVVMETSIPNDQGCPASDPPDEPRIPPVTHTHSSFSQVTISSLINVSAMSFTTAFCLTLNLICHFTAPKLYLNRWKWQIPLIILVFIKQLLLIQSNLHISRFPHKHSPVSDQQLHFRSLCYSLSHYCLPSQSVLDTWCMFPSLGSYLKFPLLLLKYFNNTQQSKTKYQNSWWSFAWV